MSVILLMLCSSDGHIPLRFHDGAFFRRALGLELWLQFHEQHHVRRSICDLARVVPHQGSWDGKCTRCGSESRVRDHGTDYRSVREPRDIFADLYFGLSFHSVEFHSTVITL
jgi:hypothetical protein